MKITAAADRPTQNLNIGFPPAQVARPVLFLTIKNGAAHTKAAEAIVSAWQRINREIPTRIVEVSEFMSRTARFTHVSAYLWLVKNAPSIWGKIDAYQKRQAQTSPTWFYRRECRKLFELVKKIQPAAVVATEVGCGEIGALIKRDLGLKIPLIAVNLDYDADRAWIQPETDLYCLATFLIQKDYLRLGADAEKIKVWGVPLHPEFKYLNNAERDKVRAKICDQFNFDTNKPVVLISGGGEGLGKIEAILRRLLDSSAQIVVLTGHNKKLKARCENIGFRSRVRVLGWTNDIAELMQSADILISKLGLTFFEAMACGLPIISFEPPPGAERIQYNLLENLGIGRAVKTVEEISLTLGELLSDKNKLQKMRAKTQFAAQTHAAQKIASWINWRIEKDNE